MKTIRVLSIAVLFGMSVTAQAAILASASIYGGSTQSLAICYLFNAGNAAIGISNVQIFVQTSPRSVALSGNNCGFTLAPGATCVFSATALNDRTYSCRAVTSTAAGVRGNFELRQGGNTVLERADMR
jgi:hypothetical protein